MVEVNESLAGDPRAVPPEVYNWAADQVFKLSREQGAQPEGFWENAAGKSLSLAAPRSSIGLSKLHGSKCFIAYCRGFIDHITQCIREP